MARGSWLRPARVLPKTSEKTRLRVHRARVTRLVKSWNKQWAPGSRALSSFNLEALAWEFVTDTSDSLDEAVELAKGCPVLGGGARVSVLETFQVM